MLVRDATCQDTYEPPYLARSTSGSSLDDASAKDKKISKYITTICFAQFTPFLKNHW